MYVVFTLQTVKKIRDASIHPPTQITISIKIM